MKPNKEIEEIIKWLHNEEGMYNDIPEPKTFKLFNHFPAVYNGPNTAEVIQWIHDNFDIRTKI